MFLAAIFLSVQLNGSQEHISLITNIISNDFAFAVQFKHKQYISFCLCLIRFSFTTGRLTISAHVYSARNLITFHFISWLSF